MANTSAECQLMIDACSRAGKKLMIAYRIQYEPHHRMVREMVQNGQFGKVKSIVANNGQNSDNPDHWQFKKALAGGGGAARRGPVLPEHDPVSARRGTR